MTTPIDIQGLIQRHLSDEVVCEFLHPGGRIGCLTPLDYPSGDGVTVWVEPHGDQFDVTDYGESLADLLSRPPQDHKAIMEQATHIARLQGIELLNGRLVGRADVESLGETAWQVASAAAQIAQLSAAFRPKRHPTKTNEFVREVEQDFVAHHVTVEKDRRLEGRSGHAHTATIFLPKQEAIVEPVGGAGHWNQISNVYAKFGDLSRANGYRPITLVDDRERALDEDKENLLVQVSNVVQWSRRGEWIDSLASPD